MAARHGRARIDDRKVLEIAYRTNIGSFETRLAIAPEAIQAILDETETKQAQAQDLIDRRYLDALEKVFSSNSGGSKRSLSSLLNCTFTRISSYVVLVG
jgi:hypothetical protein